MLEDDDKIYIKEDIKNKILEAIKKKPNELPLEAQTDLAGKRRDFVKNMTLHAWTGYKKYAWGKNELRPISHVGHSAGIFGGAGSSDLGATIVDAMDTLWLMGFTEEFRIGETWILENLDLNVNTEFSAFEVNIRFIGGLISLHSLTGKKVRIIAELSKLQRRTSLLKKQRFKKTKCAHNKRMSMRNDWPEKLMKFKSKTKHAFDYFAKHTRI